MVTMDSIDVYKNEELAVNAFKALRLRQGVVCKKCGDTHQYWLSSKQQFQCRTCKFRTTLRSGTILEGSKLPIAYFFIAAQLVHDKGQNVTTEEFQKQTRHKYYEPLSDFLRKVKKYFREHPNDVSNSSFQELVLEYSSNPALQNAS